MIRDELAKTEIAQCLRWQDEGKLGPDSMIDRLCMFARWLMSGRCIIRDVHSNLIPLYPNRAQRIILAALFTQAYNEEPLRLVILKARKPGVSTFIQALFVFLCGYVPNQVAKMLAHVADSTQEIFEIGRLIAKSDDAMGVGIGKQALKFDRHDGRYLCHTAGGEGVGAGGTPSLLHLSEVALWKQNKKDTEYTATIAVPFVPDSIIVYESTSRGRELFWDRFEAGRHNLTGYTSIFIPWYFDERNTVAGAPSSLKTTTSEESVLVRLAAADGIDVRGGPLLWRRQRIMEVGEAVFRQEYPSTPEEAIQGDSDLVVPGLRGCVISELPFRYEGLSDQQRTGGIDYGYHDATVIITAVYLDQVLYVIRVYRAAQKLSRELVVGIAQGHTYYGDPSAGQARYDLQAEIKRADLVGSVLVQAPRADERREGNVVAQEWRKVNQLAMDGRLKILDKAADQIILEADNLVWNEKTGVPDTPRGESWGHFDTMDALRYCVMGVTTGISRLSPSVLRREPTRRERLRRA